MTAYVFMYMVGKCLRTEVRAGWDNTYIVFMVCTKWKPKGANQVGTIDYAC